MRKAKPWALATVGAATAMVANAARTQEIFFMSLLQSLLRRKKTGGMKRRSRNCYGTFLNGYSARFHIGNHPCGTASDARFAGAKFPCDGSSAPAQALWGINAPDADEHCWN
jgi:hypothetical protein